VLAAKITSALEARLVGDISLRMFFDNPTVAELCEALTSLDGLPSRSYVTDHPRAFPGSGLMTETVVEKGEI
jgi:hypothetical protein